MDFYFDGGSVGHPSWAVRVTDSAAPPHPVRAANVGFQSIVSRTAPTPPIVTLGGIIITRNPMPVIVSSSQASVASDANGLATLQPPNDAVFGAVQIVETATAGASTLHFNLQSLWPVVTRGMVEKMIERDSAFKGFIPNHSDEPY
jgi:hypothetical protein